VIVTEEYARSLFNEALQSEIVRTQQRDIAALQCRLHREPWNSQVASALAGDLDDLMFSLSVLKGCIEKLHTAYVAGIDQAGERLVGAC
jgi:hypothetical protein